MANMQRRTHTHAHVTLPCATCHVYAAAPMMIPRPVGAWKWCQGLVLFNITVALA